MFTGLEGLIFFQFVIPFKLFYFPLTIKSLCFHSSQNSKEHFIKAAANEQHWILDLLTVSFQINQNLIFVTLYTIMNFLSSKIIFIGIAQSSFSHFSVLSFFISLGAKLLNQLRKTGKYWNALIPPAPEILHCCIFSVINKDNVKYCETACVKCKKIKS